ncbi:UBX domain-containing protein 4-like isoform X1 [Ptychodera flava]|uniref:UBX domain-containing protein 4-like isoform X1 n=1 Tax=Ptychodera flava TaxID=63121 RepID=UPI00396AAAE3
MRWFEGSISSAIATAKQRRAVFVIFISGDDELSQKMTETWENENVTTLCGNANMVAMKLDAKSESCQQFGAIYPVLCIPSTFFIGNNGVPLEVIGAHLSVEEFIPKIQKVIEMHKASLDAASNTAATSTARQSVPQQVSATASTSSASEGNTAFTRQTATTSDMTAEQTMESVDNTASQEPLDVRVAKAKQKIEEKKQMKAEQEKQEEIRKEMERRKLGQQVQAAEHKKKENEAKQLADELKRQRAEDRAAKERIRQQIAQDRADRAARYEKEKEEREQLELVAKLEAKRAEQEETKKIQEQANIKSKKETQEQISAVRAENASKYKTEQEEKEMTRIAAKNAKEAAERAAQQQAFQLRMESARVQFRLPDGSSIMHTFPSESPLSEARQFLYDHIGNQFGNFTLSIVYPRRQFSESDMQRSLLDLEIAPSSSLIVIPGSRSVMRSNKSSDAGIFAILLAPLLWIWSFIIGIFSSSPQSDGSTNTQSESVRPKQQSPLQTSSTSSATPQEEVSSRPVRPKSSYMRRRTAPAEGQRSRQEGNIHRLSTQDEDDDENATWNGNSTQQM